MVTSRDIARLAQVSQSSVSRALRGDPQISEATRYRIQKIAEEHNYVLSDAGRSLATGTTGRIGVIVTDLSNPYYAHLAGSLHKELRRVGYGATIFETQREGKDAVQRLVDCSVDGVIVTSRLRQATPPIRMWSAGLPSIWLNCDPTEETGDSCMLDNVAAGRLLARELMNLGHSRIGAILPPETSATSRERELGFREELGRSRQQLPNRMIYRGAYDYRTGYDGLLKLLKRRHPPTALFCYNDIIAIGAINAARRAKVRIPKDISIIGIDNIPMGAWDVFRLTTIGYDLADLVHSAVGLIIERVQRRVATPGLPRNLVFEPFVIRRESHGNPRSDELCPV